MLSFALAFKEAEKKYKGYGARFRAAHVADAGAHDRGRVPASAWSLRAPVLARKLRPIASRTSQLVLRQIAHDDRGRSVPGTLLCESLVLTVSSSWRYNGKIVGFVSVKPPNEVNQLFVAAEARGMIPSSEGQNISIAAELLQRAEQLLLSQPAGASVEFLRLDCVEGNNRAQRFYRKHGWEDVGAGTFEAPVVDGETGAHKGTFPLAIRDFRKAVVR